MANITLTIQHGGLVFTPPIEEDIKLEWERTGSPGKLTFTTINTSGAIFTEGDVVRLYYDNTPVFTGYVFSKKCDREKKINVTCYDQLRYFKNKYTYVFENKTATQIIQALCNDFKLKTGTMENSNYVIPAVAEENKSALDIAMDVLEETLLNTGNMFILYDDAGELKIKNSASMVSTTLIMEETAENFDYSSSIDSETYNQVILYYAKDNAVQLYTATSPSKVNEWGLLRHFEKVDTPSSGQNKANALLNLYNRKTRELSVKGAFGDISVRGGTLIPTNLDLGDIKTNNYMLVDKVTHCFEQDKHTMDLTLSGWWEDKVVNDTVSKTIGELPQEQSGTSGGNGSSGTTEQVEQQTQQLYTNENNSPHRIIDVHCPGQKAYAGKITVIYYQEGKLCATSCSVGDMQIKADLNRSVELVIEKKGQYSYEFFRKIGWESEMSGSLITVPLEARLWSVGKSQKIDKNALVLRISKLQKHAGVVINWVRR